METNKNQSTDTIAAKNENKPVNKRKPAKVGKLSPELTCTNCGKIFTTVSKLRTKSKMCSKSCSTIHHNKNRVWTAASKERLSITRKGQHAGENNPNWKGGGLTFFCKCCFKETRIEVNESKSGKRRGYFCSANCRDVYRRANSKTNNLAVHVTPAYIEAKSTIRRLQGVISQVNEQIKVFMSSMAGPVENLPKPIREIQRLTSTHSI